MTVAALGATAALGGCMGDAFDNEFAQYGQRITTITPTAGNAQAANEAILTNNPWPRYAFNRNIPGDGAVAVKAVNTYENPTQATGGASTTGVSAGGAQ